MSRHLHLFFQQPGSPSFVLHSPHADKGGSPAVLNSAPEPQPRELQGQHAFPLSVISVPCDPDVFPVGTRDYFVLCGCGWCSTPFIVMPRTVVCDACEERKAGAKSFAVFFAPEAARRGCHVEFSRD